ncbi:dynein beta chain, ciliary-like [Penaeus japonicus]|uniref:dynein beta chain, ciliary-like n=1 Tax=Penaeus japonicus TaxID=27405 RepID=UPI001C7164C6|nr:dynein beta chain, ciliary-like [Penaeus japonicus]
MAAPEGERENWDVLGEYTNKTLRLKADRWTKAVQHEDTRSTILDFLDGNAEQVLISQNLSNQLVSSSEVPAGLRTKGVYYLKTSDAPLIREEDNSNVREHVIFGDISPQPLDQLSTLIEEVFIPLLENPGNRDGWPDMVKEDVSRQLYSLRGTVYRMWGQLRGQTLLPLPFGMDALEKAERHALETGEMTDSQLKSAIEGVVIKWVHQVDEVLNQDTDDLAGPDHFPTPLEEITFWSKRRENFGHIAKQLKDKKVMMMSNILEVTESAYYPAFVKMCADVTMAVHEARDIMIHLTPLKPMLEEMESMEFQEATPLIPPLVHCICLLWVHCPDYRKPDRIVTLFREITNLLISMGRSFIGAIGFQAETAEPLQKINTCVSVLKTFRDSFEEHRAKVDTYFPEGERPRRWEFHPTHAFARMDQFLARLANIKEIFDIAKEFLKIEKVEFGGPKGKVLGASVSAVYSEFNEAYTAFSIRTYDCLDPAEADFDESHRQFKKKVTELEQRLSLIVNHALQESQSPEAYFKVVELLGSILERPIIQAEYTTCLPHLLQLLKQEIETAKVRTILSYLYLFFPFIVSFCL